MCASVRDATLPAFNCSLRSRSAFTRPRIGSRTVITAHNAVMAAKVATAASSVAMSTAVRPMDRVVASGVMRVPSSDLEIDHLGHDEGADAHPHHAAGARDHQARIGEEIGHIGLVDHPYHAEED